MRRRELLKLSGLSALAAVAGTLIVLPRNNPRLAKVKQILQEPYNQTWQSYYGRGSTLIYFGDGPAFEVSRRNERWTISERELTHAERSELEHYKDVRHPYLPQRIGERFLDNRWRVRGWIYNGRQPNEWILSGEQV